MSLGLLDDAKSEGRLEGKLDGKPEGVFEGRRELLRKQLEGGQTKDTHTLSVVSEGERSRRIRSKSSWPLDALYALGYLKPHDADDAAILRKMPFPGKPPLWIPMPPH